MIKEFYTEEQAYEEYNKHKKARLLKGRNCYIVEYGKYYLTTMLGVCMRVIEARNGKGGVL